MLLRTSQPATKREVFVSHGSALVVGGVGEEPGISRSGGLVTELRVEADYATTWSRRCWFWLTTRSACWRSTIPLVYENLQDLVLKVWNSNGRVS